MKSEVVQALAEFLDALPYQVQMWDRKVVDHMTGNRGAFRAFLDGCPLTKWNIYSAIKY